MQSHHLKTLERESLEHRHPDLSPIGIGDWDDDFAARFLNLMDQGLAVEAPALVLQPDPFSPSYGTSRAFMTTDSYTTESIMSEGAALRTLDGEMDLLPSPHNASTRSEMVDFNESPLTSFLLAESIVSQPEHDDMGVVSSRS